MRDFQFGTHFQGWPFLQFGDEGVGLAGVGLPKGSVGDLPSPGAVRSADDELRLALVDVLQQRSIRAVPGIKAEDIMSKVEISLDKTDLPVLDND